MSAIYKLNCDIIRLSRIAVKKIIVVQEFAVDFHLGHLNLHCVL